MRILSCKRIYEDGVTQEIDLNLSAVVMVADYFPPNSVKNGKKIADSASCAVAVSNGAVMRINYSRARFTEELRKV